MARPSYSVVTGRKADSAFAMTEKFAPALDTYVLTVACLSFMSRNHRANMKFKSKLLKFIDMIDFNAYDQNYEVMALLSLAKTIGETVVLHSFTSISVIYNRCLEVSDYRESTQQFFDVFRQGEGFYVDGGDHIACEMSDEMITWIDSFISTRIEFAYLWQSRNAFATLASRLASLDTGDTVEFNNEAIQFLEGIVSAARKNKATLGAAAQDFVTGQESFTHAIQTAHEVRNRPQSVIRTGLQQYDKLLGGGYEGGRVYIHFARSGDWKSGFLVNDACWALNPEINPEYQTKDKTRKPVVLFLTMENDMVETIERLISVKLGTSYSLADRTIEEAITDLENAYASDHCALAFRYRQSNSISTADLDTMVEELHTDGFEVVLIVQDYIKRIRPVVTARDSRHLDLGTVVDEMSIIAKKYGVPVVTGMQLNRSAYEKIEAAVKAGKADAVKELGASNVGESINVYENADVVIFHSRQLIESTKRLWIQIRRGKFRGRLPPDCSVDYFNHVFAVDEDGNTNQMLLEEDYNLPHHKSVFNLGDGVARDYAANDPPPSGGATVAQPRRVAVGRGVKAGPAVLKRAASATQPHAVAEGANLLAEGTPIDETDIDSALS